MTRYLLRQRLGAHLGAPPGELLDIVADLMAAARAIVDSTTDQEAEDAMDALCDVFADHKLSRLGAPLGRETVDGSR